jgi:TetR/AcrR family transcriptional regulator of autoinduction and epiphytic fitness
VSRARLLDATERLMVLEGYASVTTRRVASMVGLTAALVHYYYPTTEDLLVATYKRAVERHDERVRQALESERPLHALWSFYSDPKRMALGVEFMAMANHRKVIRAEIRKHDERDRRLQAEALSAILADGEIDLKMCPPLCAAMLLSGISRSLVMDEMLGISCAHTETRAFIERLLGQLERTRKARNRPRHTLPSSRG